MRRFIVGLFATIGVLAVVLVIVAVASVTWLVRGGRTPALPGQMLLTLDLRHDLPETPPAAGLPIPGLPTRLTVGDVVMALDAAARDPRVKGLVARVDDTRHGLAVAQELRQAVGRFRDGGKFAVAHAETFGELTSGNEGYYLATAFERVELQPTGLVGLTGIAAEVPFVGKLLSDIGIDLEVEKREQYKTALETFSQPDISPANREMLTSIIGEYGGQLAQGIAQGRGLDPPAVQRLVDGGPYGADEAQKAKLVDALAYYDQTLRAAVARAGQGTGTVSLEDYWHAASATPGQAPRVALVRLSGLIHSGQAGGGVIGGTSADEVAGAIADAVRDDGIKAILLRIDSGGGSAVGSDTIAWQLRRATEARKPVIVSMGNTAGSGAYWIASEGTTLLAEPATLTGSIGVVAAKPVLDRLWQRLGVTWAEIPQGENASIWSLNGPYSPAAKARVESLIDTVYAQFKDTVGRNRHMDPARVEDLAKGRVWTGSQAAQNGLVDKIGGLHEALAELRARLNLAADAPLALEPYPKPASPLKRVEKLFGESVGTVDTLARVGTALLPVGMLAAPAILVR